MKAILRFILILAVCLAVCLCGCSRQSGAREMYENGGLPLQEAGSPQEGGEEGAELPDGETIPAPEGAADAEAGPQQDNEWYANRYLRGISLYRMEDFASPSEIAPNDLVAFFFMANYEGEDKLPIPEGYRSTTDGELLLPADEVEDYVTSLFEVEAIDIATSDYYDDEKQIYVVQGFGITGGTSRVEVTAVDLQGDLVELVFDVYVTVADAQGEPAELGPVSTRSASFRDEGDRFKVLSLETLYQADMDKLMQEAGLM